MGLQTKKAMTVSIPLLVFMTLLVVGVALFYFETTKLGADKRLNYGNNALNSFYQKDYLVNFYLQDATERAAKNVNSKTEFISRFENILDAYKYPDGSLIVSEFEEIKKQLVDKNIDFIEVNGNKKATLKLDIVLKQDFFDNNKFIFSADYRYSKVFEGEI
jgi:hypothetical protein